MSFRSSYAYVSAVEDEAYTYLFENGKLMVKAAGASACIPTYAECELGIDAINGVQYIGQIEHRRCYAVEVNEQYAYQKRRLKKLPLRSCFSLLSEEQLGGALFASHIVHWDGSTKFCGTCGNQTQLSKTERAKICPSCGKLSYPRLSPAIIVAVVQGDRILLGHSSRFPAKLYSVLAGFVEPGETLEACVAREVKEETGIDVADVRYFGSQPWPFPDSLMIGFTARYAGGDIVVDETEISEAAWFSADAMPLVPDSVSISGKLIDWFLETAAKKT